MHDDDLDLDLDRELPLWNPDSDPALRELLDRPVELATAPVRSSAAIIAELEAAALDGVRALRWAMAHAASEDVRVRAARTVLDAVLRRWQGDLPGDPLGDLLRSLQDHPDGRQ